MAYAACNSRWILGQLVYYDSAYPHRWVDAEGPSVRKCILSDGLYPVDNTTGNIANGVVTVTSGGEGDDSLKPGEAGVLLATTAAGAEDGPTFQVAGEAFKFLSTNQIYFGGQIQYSSITESELMFGLCITDATMVAGISDGVYFNKLDGATTVTLEVEKDSTATASATLATMVANTYVWYEFYWSGTVLTAYIDGVATLTATLTNLPADEYLTPSVAVIYGTTAAMTAKIRNWRCIQLESA